MKSIYLYFFYIQTLILIIYNSKVMRAKSLNYNQRAVPAKNQFKMSKKEKIKKQCIFQNKLFQQWDQKQNWQIFHNSHYDWWAFPIDRSSGSYGSAYKVEVQDLNFLIQDKEFIQALKSNARLVCKSWGWNLQEGLFIKNPNKNQRWQRWPIRLSKMCRSLEIFGQVHPDVYLLFENAIKYGIKLLKEYKKFTYGGQDLTQYFIEKNNLIEQKNQNKKQSKRTERKEQKQKAESFENGYTIRSKIQGDI